MGDPSNKNHHTNKKHNNNIIWIIFPFAKHLKSNFVKSIRSIISDLSKSSPQFVHSTLISSLLMALVEMTNIVSKNDHMTLLMLTPPPPNQRKGTKKLIFPQP
ncbi:Hypothetical predicted protein [Octopus vulgaris]|uniref:Uncharacterized protein n=1 Tax=Octopus vulgaris TaxID=6645 RepID=A0AA36AY72_OCTVU|nr:Hypothetical predicted protein [Octopus vulgaris]